MPETAARPPLLRGTPRVLAGVCAGLAVHLGLPVKVVRIVMVASALLGGAGVLLYVWLWLLVPSVEDAAREADRNAAGRAGLRRVPQAGPARALGGKEILVGAALLLLAGLLAAQTAGVDVAWQILWPVLAVLGGAIIAWLQLDTVSREGLRRRAGATGAGGVVRLAAGLGLWWPGWWCWFPEPSRGRNCGPGCSWRSPCWPGCPWWRCRSRCVSGATSSPSAPPGSASPSVRRSPPTCTTRCCRPWR